MDFYSRLFAEKLGGDSSKGDENLKLAVSGNLTVITEKMLDGVTSIVSDAFWSCNLLESVTIPSSVTYISNSFGECSSLTSVEIPNSVTNIGPYTFYRCSSLKSITIPDRVTSIGYYAFSYSGLTSVEIPSSVKSLGYNVFDYCSSLTSVEISNGVTSIGARAFQNCGSLKSVTVLATTPPTLGNSNAFQNTHSSLKIYVPSASVNAYKAASGWSSYKSRIYAIPS